MLTREGVTKIIDLGLVHDADILPGLGPKLGTGFKDKLVTAAGELVGTPAYFAPEYIISGQYDQRSDQYVLGTVIYEIFSGRLPIFEESLQELCVRKATEEAPKLKETVPSIPSSFSDAVSRLLAKEPEQRYGSILEFKATLPGIFCVPRRAKNKMSARAESVLGPSPWQVHVFKTFKQLGIFAFGCALVFLVLWLSWLCLRPKDAHALLQSRNEAPSQKQVSVKWAGGTLYE
jgi:serine/threonine protein kinase